MVYYTGDIHGSKIEITRFCREMNLTEEDIVVILGDVGANYYGTDRDCNLKGAFRRLKPTIFCIHGNHEMRPATIRRIRQRNGMEEPFGMRNGIPICSLPGMARSMTLTVSGI